MKRSFIYMCLFLLAATLGFYFKSSLYLDPDLGWELRTGELILSQGFPRTDPFSYTMPNFPFVPHSWLSDIAFFITEQQFGFVGLTMLTSIALTATLVAILGLSWQSWTYLPALLLFAHFLPYAGVRPQTFSWLLFALFLRILFDVKALAKYKKYFPLLFLFWAQVHGAVFIGLFALGIHAVIERKVGIFLLSVLATLINPYGIGLWREVFTTLTSLSTHANVNEWAPIISRLDYRLVIVFALPLLFISRYWNSYSSLGKILFFILSGVMLMSGKIFPFWLVLAGFIIVQGFEFFLKDIEQNSPSKKGAKRRFSTLIYVLGIAVIVNSIIMSIATIQSYKPLSEERYYPKKAITYLKINPPQGNIFAPFGWGGYLIWKLPEKRVFIDGRMPHWGNILNEYSEIISLQSPFAKVAESYNINMVLVQKNRTNFVLLAKELQKNGWKRVYEDEVSLILIYR